MNKKTSTKLVFCGLVTDFHPLTTKNTTLTDALNATIVTTQGNEMVLQNDQVILKLILKLMKKIFRLNYQKDLFLQE